MQEVWVVVHPREEKEPHEGDASAQESKRGYNHRPGLLPCVQKGEHINALFRDKGRVRIGEGMTSISADKYILGLGSKSRIRSPFDRAHLGLASELEVPSADRAKTTISVIEANKCCTGLASTSRGQKKTKDS